MTLSNRSFSGSPGYKCWQDRGGSAGAGSRISRGSVILVAAVLINLYSVGLENLKVLWAFKSVAWHKTVGISPEP